MVDDRTLRSIHAELRTLGSAVRSSAVQDLEFEGALSHLTLLVARGLNRMWIEPNLCGDFSGATSRIEAILDRDDRNEGETAVSILAVRSSLETGGTSLGPQTEELASIYRRLSPLKKDWGEKNFVRIGSRWLEALATGQSMRAFRPVRVAASRLQDVEEALKAVAISPGAEPFTLSAMTATETPLRTWFLHLANPDRMEKS